MNQLLAYLITNGKSWVRSQRNLHRPSASQLSPAARRALAPYFDPRLLDHLRVRLVRRIANPDFYSDFERARKPIPLDFTAMTGITFIDTVLLAQDRGGSMTNIALLFHECVHAVQYRLLGIDQFVERYVSGWAQNGYQYRSIPLERDAYDLQGRFERAPDRPFSAEAEVARRLGIRQV